LPHSVAYNVNAIPAATARLAQAMGVDDAAQGLFDLAEKVGAPTALKDIGIEESDLDKAASITTETQINNPEPVTTEKVRDLLQRAWEGSSPRS